MAVWLTRESPISGRMGKMRLNTSQEKLDEWFSGGPDMPLLADFFPELSPGEREFVFTGITPSEWEELFSPEEPASFGVKERA